MTTDIVIVSAARTAVGSFNGALGTVPAHELGAAAVKAALERAKVEAGSVDEVILGQIIATLDTLKLERVHWVGESSGGIIGVLTAVGMPNFKAHSGRAHLYGATRVFEGEFNKARSMAVRR